MWQCWPATHTVINAIVASEDAGGGACLLSRPGARHPPVANKKRWVGGRAGGWVGCMQWSGLSGVGWWVLGCVSRQAAKAGQAAMLCRR
jgi:hypothetical protein